MDITLNSSVSGELTIPNEAHYYSLTLPDNIDNLTISTCNNNETPNAANFDTQLAFMNEGCSNEIAQNDDSASCWDNSSIIVQSNVAAGTYIIKMYGYGSSIGSYTLSVTDDGGDTGGGEIYGCMESAACNYDPNATFDMGCDFGHQCNDGSYECNPDNCGHDGGDDGGDDGGQSSCEDMGQIDCGEGTCVDQSQMCDGNVDCPNNMDECHDGCHNACDDGGDECPEGYDECGVCGGAGAQTCSGFISDGCYPELYCLSHGDGGSEIGLINDCVVFLWNYLLFLSL